MKPMPRWYRCAGSVGHESRFWPLGNPNEGPHASLVSRAKRYLAKN